VLTISGCSATTAAPKGPTKAELNERVRVELDRQWQFTGLDGVVPRPETDLETVVASDGFSPNLQQCMSDAGIESWGTGPEGLDMSMVNSDGAESTPEQEYAFYQCSTRYPNIDPLSDAQLDFVYDYYQRWLIPCLAERGYLVTNTPTRAEFHEYRAVNGWLWGPYSSMEVSIDGPDLDALIARCKPTIPGMDGWSKDGLFG